MRRIISTVVIAAVVLMAGAPPAAAHSVAGTGATNYKTTLRRVEPAIPGLHIKVVEAGSRLELSYTGSKTVYVLGLVEEPFLRVDRRGVFENRNSPYTYISRTRDGVDPPASVDPRKPPRWRKVADGRIARWHDHRVHFMGHINPPQVRREPDERHVIQPDWQVLITDGTTTAVAHGDLVWVPGPSPAPWVALALSLVVAMVVIGLRRPPYAAIAAATAAVIAVDVAHSFAVGFANAGTTLHRLALSFGASIVSVPAWVVGGAGVWLLLRKRVDGYFAAVFCGAVVAVVGGVADVAALSRSQIPFGLLPVGLARPIVAVSLGLGVGLAVTSGVAIRRTRQQADGQ